MDWNKLKRNIEFGLEETITATRSQDEMLKVQVRTTSYDRT